MEGVIKTNSNLVSPPLKIKCKNCPRMIKPGKLIINKRTGLRVCRICDRKLGTNKFYTPIKNIGFQKDFVGKYTISSTERKILQNKSQYGAFAVSKWLSLLKKKKIQQSCSNEENKALEKEGRLELKKKFLEGLKQA